MQTAARSRRSQEVTQDYRVDTQAHLTIDQTLGTWINNVLVTIALAITIFIAGVTLFYLQALTSLGEQVHRGLGITLMALAFVTGVIALLFTVFCVYVHARRRALFARGRIDFAQERGYSYAWIYVGTVALALIMIVAMIVVVYAASLINQT